ncbi:hypothetical protein Pint_11560 [Pistacia integerrima]|uniref:Uncharacterized protein n=2 Tax=Pistacia TaxID=55512 RepID=A0ACC1A041_9ROSI|nr:hypothetical protein Pint_11560 [Pistacia integerrima]KAJ0080679.1 hypothetical protein Patl1_11751 [Pistacia atlantica]
MFNRLHFFGKLLLIVLLILVSWFNRCFNYAFLMFRSIGSNEFFGWSSEILRS